MKIIYVRLNNNVEPKEAKYYHRELSKAFPEHNIIMLPGRVFMTDEHDHEVIRLKGLIYTIGEIKEIMNEMEEELKQ